MTYTLLRYMVSETTWERCKIPPGFPQTPDKLLHFARKYVQTRVCPCCALATAMSWLRHCWVLTMTSWYQTRKNAGNTGRLNQFWEHQSKRIDKMMRGNHTEAGMVRFQKRTICNHPYLDEFFNNHPILDDSSRPLFGTGPYLPLYDLPSSFCLFF